jgi:hypothetical protein
VGREHSHDCYVGCPFSPRRRIDALVGEPIPLHRLNRESAEADMVDDRRSAWRQDGAKINASRDDEVRAWAKKFGVTPAGLRAAVTVVGSNAKDVQRHLQPIEAVIDPYF